MKYDTNKSIRKKIDKLLEKNASINAGLGTDSTAREYKQAQKEIKANARKIKEIDKEFWDVTFGLDD